jgi:hypothetical protein
MKCFAAFHIVRASMAMSPTFYMHGDIVLRHHKRVNVEASAIVGQSRTLGRIFVATKQ